MAHLKHAHGQTTDLEEIAGWLDALHVTLQHWPVNVDGVGALLEKPALSEAEKEAVLEGHDHYFAQLKDAAGYQTRDLVVIHPNIPGLDGMLAKFDKIHTHDDDEVRYIVEGEGMFGFVLPDGEQVQVTVQPGEYINVPANTEHWFEVTATQRIKAVRYFTTTEGWTPRYTGRPVRDL